MAQSRPPTPDLLARLEARHTELLEKLGELECRVEQALASLTRQEKGASGKVDHDSAVGAGDVE